MQTFVNDNGCLLEEAKVCLSPNNRSFRYGDGCFETLKVINGNLLLKEYHFRRLFSTLQALQFTIPAYLTAQYLEQQILETVYQNKQQLHARVRLTFHRGSGALPGLSDTQPSFIIQTAHGLAESLHFNTKGLSLDYYYDSIKCADKYSRFKTNNYLGSVMGTLFAKEKKLDDCIFLNYSNRVVETTIANIYIVQNNSIVTPPVAEGCVEGVMRKFLLQQAHNLGYHVSEKIISPNDVTAAAEVFITNANIGLRWIGNVGATLYNKSVSEKLYRSIITPLFTL